VLRAADLITSDAAMLSEAIRALAGRHLAPLTVPMGVDAALLAGGDPAAPRPPVILHNRNLEPVYDLPTVLRGLAPFLHAHSDWELRLAGDGSQRAALERLAADLGLADRARFLGRLPRTALMDELRGARIYLSASLSDSTSVSLLEAMALGAYPVLSDIPANREWIPGAPGAQYFAPGRPEALAQALAAAADLPAAARRAALEANRAIVRARAVWEDNMAAVRAAFLALVERQA
jgi:glycosyltransferase involved in cell wall biosynthesis